MPVIPLVNLDVAQVAKVINEKIEEPKAQRKLILVIVCVALLLDNMLYMVIVPIIPAYLRTVGASSKTESVDNNDASTNQTNTTQGLSWSLVVHTEVYTQTHDETIPIGFLFASKAIIQLFVNPFSGAFIDKIGYEKPMMIGLSIMFLSTSVFAFGTSYGVLFIARSLQGVGSAFADTAGLAMIADRFSEESERTKALGIALAFISFGCLVAPPFGGILYQYAGKTVPFLILSTICLIDGLLLFLVTKRPVKIEVDSSGQKLEKEKIKGTPIYRLLMDPFIAVTAGALSMSNVSLAFLEPTIGLWMKDTMNATATDVGIIWLPAFIPHVFGVYLTVKLAQKYPNYQWLMAAIGLSLEGIFTCIVPFAKSFWVLIIPICGICFGIALVDTALLPTLGYVVDVRHVSVYGSVYAIADISYSLAYAIGPIIAGEIVHAIGFLALNIIIALTNLSYAPVLAMLRVIYKYKPFENEMNLILDDPPTKTYRTYTMHSPTDTTPQEIEKDEKNHLDFSHTFVEEKQDKDRTQRGYKNQNVNPLYNHKRGKDTDNILGSSDSE